MIRIQLLSGVQDVSIEVGESIYEVVARHLGHHVDFIVITDENYEPIHRSHVFRDADHGTHFCVVVKTLFDASVIEPYLNRSTWRAICKNEGAIPFIRRNLDQVDWPTLCANRNAIEIIEEEIANATFDKSWLPYLCMNRHPRISAIIRTHFMEDLTDVCWMYIMANKNAMELIDSKCAANECKPEWLEYLCQNENAAHLIERFPGVWENEEAAHHLCANPGAIDLIRLHIRNIDRGMWPSVCRNPNLDQIGDIIPFDKLYLQSLNVLIVNKGAIQTIRNNIDLIKKMIPEHDFYMRLCVNEHEQAVDMVREYMNNIWSASVPRYAIDECLYLICLNKNAIDLILHYWDRLPVNGYFSKNENAIPILRSHPEKINWESFCQNPNFSQLIQ
jgi:hypothetical protein